MNQVERDELIALQSPLFPLIVAGDLSCQANRTLLNQGSLTVDRHVYLFNGTIYVADILSDTAYRSLAKVNSNYVYDRDSRVCFKSSDYEFCRLLIERGCNLNFISGEPIPHTHYQLPIWPEHAQLSGCPSSPWMDRVPCPSRPWKDRTN